MVAYLAHHGIKGMKWGVRRTPAQLGHVSADAGGGGGGEPVDEEMAKLNKQLAEGTVQWESLSTEMQQRYKDYFSKNDKVNSNISMYKIGKAKDEAVDYLTHIPSDGLFQFTRKDGTGLMNTKEDAERYKRQEKAKADVRAFAEQEIRRRKESEAAGEEAARQYKSSPGSVHSDTKDYGMHEVTSVYRNDSQGRPQRVGSRARNKQTGEVSYTNTNLFGIGTDPKQIDSLISSGNKREEYARKRGKAQYDRQWVKHEAFDQHTRYLAHHGVKGMKWGVRRSPDQLQMRAAKFEKKAAQQRVKAAKNERKMMKRKASLVGTLYPGDSMWGPSKFENRMHRANAKAAKYDLKASKMKQKALKKKLQLKASEVDPETKASGKKYIAKFTG